MVGRYDELFIVDRGELLIKYFLLFQFCRGGYFSAQGQRSMEKISRGETRTHISLCSNKNDPRFLIYKGAVTFAIRVILHVKHDYEVV